MAIPAGPIQNTPDFRTAIRQTNGFASQMAVYMEKDEASPYKGWLFIKFLHQGDDRYLPLGPWTAVAPYPIALVNPALVGSRTIAEVLGEKPDDPTSDVVMSMLEEAGIAVPPAPLVVYTELGRRLSSDQFVGQMFVKYAENMYRSLRNYDFTVSSLEKPILFTGDLDVVFDPAEVDSRFVNDYLDRNS